ncbi:hypothetical protein [Alysiella crassa]|uniref:hypothetical protein n=1 Tax=Alysiella crassa TaxID=153491 RepID=UPI0012EC5BB6|nr:hypothetical protein [Alysiella crassa]UOP06790.1 hypothetical protein LVJ80_13940 [Alysiella crassa]
MPFFIDGVFRLPFGTLQNLCRVRGTHPTAMLIFSGSLKPPTIKFLTQIYDEMRDDYEHSPTTRRI